jgi:hypothetical protein
MYSVMREIDPGHVPASYEAVPGPWETAGQVCDYLTDPVHQLGRNGRRIYVVTPDGEEVDTSQFIYDHAPTEFDGDWTE